MLEISVCHISRGLGCVALADYDVSIPNILYHRSRCTRGLPIWLFLCSVVENFDQLRYDNKYYGFLTFIARHFNSHCMQWFIIQASCLRGKAHFLLLKLYIAIPCLYIAMLCLFMGPFIARCLAPFLVFPPCFSNKSSCSFLCAFASCSSPCSAY